MFLSLETRGRAALSTCPTPLQDALSLDNASMRDIHTQLLGSWPVLRFPLCWTLRASVMLIIIALGSAPTTAQQLQSQG
jgi:hypothetical protein